MLSSVRKLPDLRGHLICCIPLLAAAIASAAPVKVWQDTTTLPTYAEDPPELSPPFELLPVKTLVAYPYPIRDRFATDSAPQTWRQLNLENEFLACRFLPDLGGRIYSCRDKLSGQEMFYANSVVKKALYGVRGAFAAVGVEPNFPKAHSPQNVSPVDFATASNSDGSASVWIASTARDTGMRWRIEFRLRAGSALLEETVFLYNGTAAAHPYQWWNNAAVAVDDPELRVIFPTHFTLDSSSHKVNPWPIVDSNDLSVIANHKDSAELSAVDSREPFLAVYHPRTRSGMAHYADPTVLTGKKLFVWGTQLNRRVRQQLSDDNSTYIELQAGLFPTPDRYEFLAPQQSRLFYEYWMPARNLDGISRANLHAVLYLGRIAAAEGKTSVRIEMNANHAIDGATIRLSRGSQSVFETKTDLAPAGTYSRTVENLPAEGSYTLELLDHTGQLLLSHTENKYDAAPSGDLAKPVPPAPPQTEQDYESQGLGNERTRTLNQARDLYAAGLKQFPESIGLRKAAGRVAVALNRFAEAVETLSPAAARAPADPEIAYYLGVALSSTGDEQKARTAWQSIQADPQFGPPAAFELACLLARSGDLSSAIGLLRATGEAPQSPRVRAGAALVALLRRSGQAPAARHQLELWLAADPTSPLIRFEQALQKPADDFWMHLAADPERVLEIADHYIHLGFFEDALKVLDHVYPAIPPAQAEPGAVLPQDQPLVVYYRGYCRQRLGQPAHADFQTASRLSTRYVFPSRASSFAVLQAALRDNPSDGPAHLLLGDLYMSGDQVDEAIDEWQKARAAQPSLETVHRNLARALLELKHNPADGLEVLRNAGRLDPAAPDILESFPAALTSFAAGMFHDDPAADPHDPRQIARQAFALTAEGRTGEASALFKAENLPQERQPIEIQQAYIEMKLQVVSFLAEHGRCELALSAAEALGDENKALPFTLYGFHNFEKSARVQYYLAVSTVRCGEAKESRKRLEKIAKSSNSDPSAAVYAALAALRLGEPSARSKAEAALNGFQSAPAGDKTARATQLWAQGMLLCALDKPRDGIIRLRQAAELRADLWSQYLAVSGIREALLAAGSEIGRLKP